MANRYIKDDDGLLYRMDVPRDKRLAKLKPVVRRLCVPRPFRHEIVKFTHEQNGHYAVQGLFHALATRFIGSLCLLMPLNFAKHARYARGLK